MGAAVPLFVDVENMQLAFLISLPFIKPENIYQLKMVLNVGIWNGSYLITLETPPVVAFQGDKFTQYLVPHLNLCKKAKHLHWLCPGKPFVKDTSEVLCGLNEGSPFSKCKLTITKEPSNETRVAIANGQWLVNTPLQELTISYAQHHSITKMAIEPGVSLITVPEDAVIHIGDTALYYLDQGVYQSEVEVVDIFRGHNLAIPDDLNDALSQKATQSVKIIVRNDGLTWETPRPTDRDFR